jgi:hypothetical protein
MIGAVSRGMNRRLKGRRDFLSHGPSLVAGAATGRVHPAPPPPPDSILLQVVLALLASPPIRVPPTAPTSHHATPAVRSASEACTPQRYPADGLPCYGIPTVPPVAPYALGLASHGPSP